MKPGQVRLVYRKEMMDLLRDRRTLYSMIVVPILVIPGLMLGLTRAMIRMVEKAEKERAPIVLLGAENAPEIAALIRAHPKFEVVSDAANYRKRIEDKELRLAVEFPPDFERHLREDRTLRLGQQVEAGSQPAIRLYYHEDEMRSEQTLRVCERILEAYRDHLVKARLTSQNLSPDLLQPFSQSVQNVASAERVGAARVGGIIPYIVILLTLTGAMYPAIDTTAGEKERGTIETILASPISRTSLAMGKFLAVLTAALCTSLLSLLSLGLSSRLTGGGEMARALPFALALNGRTVAAMLLMVLPVAVLFSGALLAIALMAKSYKEAQSYISPLMIVVILPAVAAMLPGVELTPKLALIPILNVSLVTKELVAGVYNWKLIAEIFATSCLYAAIALSVAIRAFQRESVLFRT
jgi:sodium transport system permease protein